MPQFRNSQTCHGFVNPAHLYSSFPMVYDQDISGQQHYGYTAMDDSMPSDFHLQEPAFDAKAAQRWKAEPVEYSVAPTWPGENGLGTPSIRDDCSASSASNSPSPGNTTSQQGQSHKRRAQNRAA